MDDNQSVQAGTLLIELDPSDNKVALQQAQAQYDEALAQLGASHPSLPITQIGNLNDLTSQRAEVVASEASLAAAQHDFESSLAKLKESQAVDERNQADFSRHKALYDDQIISRADFDQYKATAAAQTQTQLARMRSGQHVRMYVDALHDDFDGTVESMPAVTGSRTSVLPPENATGNYVKVIQRLPVRIRINEGQKDMDKLRPGMSVEPKVHLD